MEAKNTQELKEIKEKIKKARAWALKHFNADKAKEGKIINEDLTLAKPSFFVSFPTPDTMIATPSCMGKSSIISIDYKLAFNKDGSVSWIGTHPFYGTEFPPLKVTDNA
jgi:hypothetical protein